MNRRNIILLTFATFLLFVFVGGYLFLQSNFFLNKIRGLLEIQISTRLNHEITIERLSGNILRYLKAEQITVVDKHSDSPLLAAEEVRINYKLWGLLRGRFLVDELTFIKPLVDAELAKDGTLNLTTLRPKAEVKKQPTKSSSNLFDFLGISHVRLDDGTLNYIDKIRNISVIISGFSMRIHGPPNAIDHDGEFEFHNGSIDINGVKKNIDKLTTTFHLSFEKNQLSDSRGKPLSLQTQLRMNMGNSWVEAISSVRTLQPPFMETTITSELDLQDIKSFLPEHSRLEGQARIDINASGTLKEIAGKFGLTLPSAYYNDIEIQDLHITADFTQNSFKMTKLSCAVADGRLTSTATLNLTNEQLAYQSAIQAIDLKAEKFIPMLVKMPSDGDKSPDYERASFITGVINGKFTVAGILPSVENLQIRPDIIGDNLKSEGTFSLSNGTCNGVALQDISADYKLADDVLSFRGDFDIAQAELQGALGLIDRIALDMRLTHIDLAKISAILFPSVAVPTGLNPVGNNLRALPSISGEGAISAKIGGTLEKPRITASLDIPRAMLNDISLGTVEGRFSYEDKQVHIEEIVLRKMEHSGEDTQCILSGNAMLRDNIDLELKLSLTPLRLASYTPLLSPSLPLSGLATGDILLRGALNALNGKADLKITQGNLYGFLIDPFTLPVRIEANTIGIPQILISSNEDNIQLSCSFAPNGDYKFQLLSNELDIAKIFKISGINQPVEGTVTLEVGGDGNITNPSADITLNFDKIRYAGQELGHIAVKGTLKHNNLETIERGSPPAARSVGLQPPTIQDKIDIQRSFEFYGTAMNDTIQVTGALNIPENIMDIQNKAKEASLPFTIMVALNDFNIRPLVNILYSDIHLDGKLSGSLQFAGDVMDVPRLKSNISLQQVTLNTQNHNLFNLEPIEIEFTNQTAYVKVFELFEYNDLFFRKAVLAKKHKIERTPDAAGAGFQPPHQRSSATRSVVALNGHLGPNFMQPSMPLDLSLTAEALDVSLLCDLLGVDQVISGAVKLGVDVTGTAESPTMTLSLVSPQIIIPHPVQPISLTSISGSAVYSDRLFRIDKFSLQLSPEAGLNTVGNDLRHENVINLTGEIPVDLAFVVPTRKSADIPGARDVFRSRIPEDSNMALQLTAPNIQLDHLTPFIPDISEITGNLKFIATITGNLLNPEVTGTVALSAEKIISTKFPQPIEHLSCLAKMRAQPLKESDVATIELKTLQAQIGTGYYTAFGGVAVPSLLSALRNEKILKPSFFLILRGEDVDFITPFRLSGFPAFRQSGIAGHADVFAQLWGSGTHINDVKAEIVIDDVLLQMHEAIIPHRGGAAVHEVTVEQSEHSLYKVRNAGSIRLSLSDGRLQCNALRMRTDDSPTPIVSMSGYIDVERRVDIHLKCNQLNLALASPFLGPQYSPRGLASCDINIDGLIEEPRIEATWEISDFGVKGGVVHSEAPTTSGRSNTDQREQVGQLVQSPRSIRLFRGCASYRDEKLDLPHLQIIGFGNELTVTGKIPINLALTPMPLHARLPARPIDVTIKGESIGLDVLQTLSNHVKSADGAVNIDLGIRGTSAKPHLVGTIVIRDGMVQLSNFDTPLESMVLRVKANEGQIQLDELSFHIGDGRYAANANLSMDGLMPRILVVDAFRVENAQIADFARNFLTGQPAGKIVGHINAEMHIDEMHIGKFISEFSSKSAPKIGTMDILKQMSGKLNITDVQINTAGYDIYNPSPIEVTLENQAVGAFFKLKERKDKTFSLTAFGNWKLGEDLHLKVDGVLDMGLVSEFITLPYELRGGLKYDIEIRGTESDPRINCEWNTENFAIQSAPMESLTGKINYYQQKLTIEEIRVAISDNSIVLKGVIPTWLSLSELDFNLLDAESKLFLDAQFNSLSFIPLIDNQYADAEGIGKVSITIGGDITAPKFSGFAEFRDVALRSLSNNLEIRDTDIQLTFLEDKVTIEYMRGELNDGTYQISGSVGLSQYIPSIFNIDGTWEDCIFEAPGIFEITCDGNAELRGTLKSPRLDGMVALSEGTLTQTWKVIVRNWFDTDNVNPQYDVYYDYPILRNLEMNLGIQAANNVWMDAPSIAKIENSVDGRIVGPLNKFVFIGHVELLGGELWYFEHKFNVISGRVDNNSTDIFDPEYTINAKTAEPLNSIPLLNGNGEIQPRDMNIMVTLTGTLENPGPPNLRAEILDKEPGEQYELDRQQIISILTVGIPEIRNLNGLLYSTAPELLKKQAEWYLGSRFAGTLGLRELRFDIRPEAFEESRFFFAKELTPNWAITYSSTLQLHKEQRIEMEYQLRKTKNKQISITGERNEKGKYGVDLKLEYLFR